MRRRVRRREGRILSRMDVDDDDDEGPEPITTHSLLLTA